MADFYDLIDTYAQLNNIDRAEVLHLWYRGNINAEDLLEAVLEDEGFFGNTTFLINAIKTLAFRSRRDGKEDPWAPGV